MNLTIREEMDNNKAVLFLSGEIDVYTAPELKEAILPLISKDGNFVQVDLKDVTYMDSTGLGVFVNAFKSSKDSNSKLQLVNLQDRVYRLFKITGLHEIMDINDTIRGGKA